MKRLSAALAKSVPLDLPSGFRTRFKDSLVFLQFSFLRRHKPKMIFG